MNRPIATMLISFAVLCIRSGMCFGFAVRRIGDRFDACHNHRSSRRPHSKLVRPMTEPTSSSLRRGRSDPDKEEAEKSTEEGRTSKRKRLSNLARRFRRIFRPFPEIHEDTTSLDDASQGNASSIRIEEIEEKSSQGRKMADALPPDDQGTLLNDVPPRDVTVPIEKTKEQIITPIKNALVIPTDDPMPTRQSRSAEHVDLSGSWRPIVTPEFKMEYDSYLANCSQSFLFRKVVVNGIGYQKEVIRQLNDGVDLEIIATNPAGNWNRTLKTSDGMRPLNVTITDPDGDRVQIEAWWEGEGTRHKSILRGKPNVDGGVFETVRYLESDDVLACESKFYPSTSSTMKEFKYGHVVWKFQRDQQLIV